MGAQIHIYIYVWRISLCVKNYTLCVKFHTVCKTTHFIICVYLHTLCKITHFVQYQSSFFNISNEKFYTWLIFLHNQRLWWLWQIWTMVSLNIHWYGDHVHIMVQFIWGDLDVRAPNCKTESYPMSNNKEHLVGQLTRFDPPSLIQFLKKCAFGKRKQILSKMHFEPITSSAVVELHKLS